ncbi:MAG: glycine--tRNA ligase subunit alpha [Christensenellaceae bacterium]|jgi:glycyl-tRNA synthetase alpha chain|nr:glycine--tRNA ligase subunit alpha [Christensenellaceae bacterium]
MEAAKTLQDLILRLHEFWSKNGCAIGNSYDVETGAGTMNPLTFFNSLGAKPAAWAYVEPSRRPKDGRYGDNPNRLYQHHQYQVIIKPSPDDIVDTYIKSLEYIGFNKEQHDIRFVEDNWESPTLGAFGRGWEVWLDGMEISQYTFFQQMGTYKCSPVTVEMTYGLERISMYLQNCENVYDLKWNDKVKYGEIFKKAEFQHSKYSFEDANVELLLRNFKEYEEEALRLLELKLRLPAYDFVLKCSHTFNVLDAKGAISVTERAYYITRIRNLAKRAAELYLAE